MVMMIKMILMTIKSLKQKLSPRYLQNVRSLDLRLNNFICLEGFPPSQQAPRAK